MRRATRALGGLVLGGLVLVAGTGCSGPDPGGPAQSTAPAASSGEPATSPSSGAPTAPTSGPSASPSDVPPAGPQVLAALQRRGGRCPDGPCESSLVVTTDGTWVRTGVAQTQDGSGHLDEAQLRAVRDAVEETRLGSAPAFEGTCPTASDGQEVVVSWLADGALRTAAGCTVEVPDSDPLLRTLRATLEALPAGGG